MRPLKPWRVGQTTAIPFVAFRLYPTCRQGDIISRAFLGVIDGPAVCLFGASGGCGVGKATYELPLLVWGGTKLQQLN